MCIHIWYIYGYIDADISEHFLIWSALLLMLIKGNNTCDGKIIVTKINCTMYSCFTPPFVITFMTWGLNDWIGVYEWVKVLLYFSFMWTKLFFILCLQRTKVLWVMRMFFCVDFIFSFFFCLCVCFVCILFLFWFFLNICNTVIHVWWEYECCIFFFFVCVCVCVEASKEIIKPSSMCGCESFFLSLRKNWAGLGLLSGPTWPQFPFSPFCHSFGLVLSYAG